VIHVQIVGTGTLPGLPSGEPSAFGFKDGDVRGAGSGWGGFDEPDWRGARTRPGRARNRGGSSTLLTNRIFAPQVRPVGGKDRYATPGQAKGSAR